MCGRFTLATDPAGQQQDFGSIAFPSQFAPRYNIAPSQPVMVVPNNGRQAADFFVWGMIPSWAKDASIGSRLINARSETLAEKPAFRESYRNKRCLILADGFYEWKARPDTKRKTPHYIQLASRKVFALAGLWSEWQAADGSVVRSCSIITTSANATVAPIHSRMPAILRPEDHAAWLDPEPRSADSLGALLGPFPDGLMGSHEVSTLVNSPANDRAECVLPADRTTAPS
jgi:putative SOS response-associated peptidase YedK